ncbi:MAG: glycosyl hydrolase [Chloroflexi bacterium]|nr:glycosyl hydrolase [Chloroflexota bacterium]
MAGLEDQNLNQNLGPALQWRCIGPFRGGRVVAVAGDPTNPAVFYFGACAGGVWKTEDAGMYWQNVSDGYFKTSAVGALAVSPSDPQVIYAGTGETTIRIDVSHGDGVYRSTDGGATWVHAGLEDTRHIAKIRIHPQNPDLVYVAALGHAFGPNQQRGVFRSHNGGKTWEQVLYRSEKAGAIDLTMDANPRILYAATWEARRSFSNITSGGLDSAIYKSMDGGDSWTDITRNPGLPQGILGKIGLAASPAQPGRIWALIEAKEGGLYRSDDGGKNWERVSDNYDLISRAWYFTHIVADPQDGNTVYIMNLAFWKSIDGGRNFTQMPTPHGDNHDLWIDPHHPRWMIEGHDGGACVSLNGGESWSSIYNQPTAQFYRMDISREIPYRVYGTQQDNTSIGVPSRSETGAITWGDCRVAGTGESGYIAVDPRDPNIVFIGAVGSSPGGGDALQRYDHTTRQLRLVSIWPEWMSGWGAKDMKYRFPWTYPILFSPHDPRVLYAAGNMIFRSTDHGNSWESISPDLTRADPATLEPSGGPVNKDAVGAEVYGTIFAFVESPHEAGVFWAGSDDGLIHLSKDGGRNWANVTPQDLPEFTMISTIEVSPYDPATAYVAAIRHKHDDYRPYVYRTNNYGQSWLKITGGFSEHDFVRVVREDPSRPGLLYAGTETGLYVSFNAGAAWQPLQLNLPVTPIYDLKIKDTDLVAATHGRSFWILDDLTPLHRMSAEITQAEAYLFPPRPAYRTPPDPFATAPEGISGKFYAPTFGAAAAFTERKSPDNVAIRTYLDAGANPPAGATLDYYLKIKPTAKISLEVLDAAGNVIRQFFSREEGDGQKGKSDEKPGAPTVIYVPAEAGLNRFVWDMRYADAIKIQRKDQPDTVKGPIALPGTYQVRLTAGEMSFIQPFEIRKFSYIPAGESELQAQFDLMIKIRDKVSETHAAINRILSIEQQLDDWVKKTAGLARSEELAQGAGSLKEKLRSLGEALVVPAVKSPWDVYNYGTRLAARLVALAPVVYMGDGAPTQQAYEVFDTLTGKIDTQLQQLQVVIETDLAAFNLLVRDGGFAAVILSQADS